MSVMTLSEAETKVYAFMRKCDSYPRDLPQGRPLGAADRLLMAKNVWVGGRYKPDLTDPLKLVVAQMKREGALPGDSDPELREQPDEVRAMIGILQAVGG